MAHDLTANPWILDNTAAVVTTERLRIQRVRWVGPTDAAHAVTLKNNALRAMLKLNAEAVGVDVEVDDVAACPGEEWAGLTIETGDIPSGTVYLTYK